MLRFSFPVGFRPAKSGIVLLLERTHLQHEAQSAFLIIITCSRRYYRGAAAALIIFDATNKASFESITRWVTEIQNASTEGRDVILYIVANKTDLEDQRQVSQEDVQLFISNHGVQAHACEVSAKENRGIATVFEAIARKIADGGRRHQRTDS